MATARATKRPKTVATRISAEEKAFLKNRPKLLKRYRGRFVAMFRGVVVGHADNDEELAQRMFEKLGDVPFYIAKVQEELPTYEFSSPETD